MAPVAGGCRVQGVSGGPGGARTKSSTSDSGSRSPMEEKDGARTGVLRSQIRDKCPRLR